MNMFFQYNWHVRDDGFTWCEDVPEEELSKKRVGGLGSILYTLFHVVEVERSWIEFLNRSFADTAGLWSKGLRDKDLRVS